MSLFGRNDRRKDIVPVHENPFEDLWSRFLRTPAMLENRLPEIFSRGNGSPALNFSEDENVYHVSLELPGLNEEDIDIQLMGRQVIVSGERRWEEEKKGKEFHRVESQYGRFERAVTLPQDCRLEEDAIEAVYAKGILDIMIPKVEPTPTRKVPVKTG